MDNSINFFLLPSTPNTSHFRPVLHQELELKKLGAHFEHFWLVVWPQVTNKCQNIDIRILINVGTLTPRVANWLLKFDGILFFFPGQGSTYSHKVQHLLVTWGRLNICFFFYFQPSVESFRLISTFAPIGMLDLS